MSDQDFGAEFAAEEAQGKLAVQAKSTAGLLEVLATIVLLIGAVSVVVMVVVGFALGVPGIALMAIAVVLVTLVQYGLLRVGSVVAGYVALRAGAQL